MEMLSKSLTMSQHDNELGLAEAEKLAKKQREMGNPEGNRHQRRLAQRRARLEARKERV